MCWRLLLREGTCQKSKRTSQQYPYQIRLLASGRRNSTRMGRVFKRYCSKVTSGHLLQGPEANRHFFHGGSSKPASQLSVQRGTSLSKTLIIVSRSMGLQDALWVLLHQRAPSHFPCQQQILTIHGIQVLHLQVERARNRR